ncbi:MAG: flagellar export chaperone FlgN [Planctomycetaceae bacterium]
MFTPDSLVDLLDEQGQLLDRLIESGDQQQQAIVANRMSELVAILAQKQPHLERLGEIRQELQRRRPEIEGDGFWRDAAVRNRCRSMQQRAAELFARLIELEGNCEHALVQSRDQIQQRLQTVDTGRHAASAYQSQSTGFTAPRIDFSSLG